jgi:ribosomal silencing factor RsfS
MEICEVIATLEMALNLLPEKNRQKYAQDIADLKIVERDAIPTSIMYTGYIRTLAVKIADELKSFAKDNQLNTTVEGIKRAEW